MIHSHKGQISTAVDELKHDQWPCVPLPLHYDIDGNLLPCAEAVRQRAINQGFILRTNKAKHHQRPTFED